MKNPLRLALPPLDRITPDSVAAFALFDGKGQLLRSGELPLSELARAVPADQVHVVLHPGDAIVATVQLPPLPAKRLDAAVEASVEPMALSDTSSLCIAHGPRDAEGYVCAVWTDRQALLQAWRQLDDAGFKVVSIVPFPLAIPDNDPHPDLPLALPVNDRWRAPLPRWSLARPEWRPASQVHRWRRAALWGGGAALLWLAGLQIYAAQLRGEARTLQVSMEQAVRKAFPSIPVVIDPVTQARKQRDMLRLKGGAAGEDDFMPLAMGAARVLGFADGHVASLHYEKGELTLTLAEGYTPPANEAALHQAAAVQSLVLEKDDNVAHTWHIRRAAARAKESRQ